MDCHDYSYRYLVRTHCNRYALKKKAPQHAGLIFECLRFFGMVQHLRLTTTEHVPVVEFLIDSTGTRAQKTAELQCRILTLFWADLVCHCTLARCLCRDKRLTVAVRTDDHAGERFGQTQFARESAEPHAKPCKIPFCHLYLRFLGIPGLSLPH